MTTLPTTAPLVRLLGAAVLMLAAALCSSGTASAQAGGPNDRFSLEEVVTAGNDFFGDLSSGLATIVEKAVADYGQPNGYILGQEGSGAFVGGLRYGEGTLFTRNAGSHKVYWQGPSLGIDFGADGARTMILVYDLPSVEAIYRRYGGVNGSAYFVGGFGLTALRDGDVVLVPVRSGVGARVGLNVGYLKFTPQPTWNPF